MTTLYTIESANRTLPYVRAVTGELRELYRWIQIESRKHNALPKNSDARPELRTKIREKASRLKVCQEELLAIDLQVRDYDLGLIDFPSELKGRPIFLCWEFGEERIGHWHEADAGYRGRRPVPEGQPTWPLGANALPAGRD